MPERQKHMSVLISFIWIILSTFTLSALLDRKFEIVFPVSLFSAAGLIYICGMFDNLILGYYISWILILCGLVFIGYRKYNLKKLLKNYVSVGFIIFIILFAYLNLYHQNTFFKYFDEWLHWGNMVKEQFRLNQFYSVPESVLQIHKDYPPLISLIELLWCFFGGKYAETYIYRALALFVVSLILPVAAKLEMKRRKDWIRAGFILAGILLVNVINFEYALNGIFMSIYIDFPLAFLAAYTTFVILRYFEEKSVFNFVNVLIGLTALLMSKQMGIAFFALNVFIFIVKKAIIDREYRKYDLMSYVLAILVPAVVFFSWEAYTAQFQVSAQFEYSQFSIASFVDIVFRGEGEAWRVAVVGDFLSNVFNRPLINFPVNLNYVNLSLILFVILMLIVRFVYRKEEKMYLLPVTYILGAVAYATAMLMLYLFSFGEYEASYLASFSRYMDTYLLFGITLVFMLVAYFVNLKSRREIIVYVLCFAFLLSLVNSNYTELKFKEYDNYQEAERIVNLSDKFQNLEPGDRVVLVMQYYDDFLLISRYLYPEFKIDSINLGQPKYKGDVTVDFSKEEWIEYLKDYDYIFLYTTDYPFYSDYWKAISDFDYIDGNIYKLEDGVVVE